MDNGDKQLLREVHGSVSRIAGALPYLATREDLGAAITKHARACGLSRAEVTQSIALQRPSQAPAKRALTGAKTKLYIAAAGLFTSAAGLIAWWIATH